MDDTTCNQSWADDSGEERVRSQTAATFATSDSLGKQLSLPPFKSFLRLNFRRIIDYILENDCKTSSNVRTAAWSDTESLNCLINELRASFDAICEQDYKEFVRSTEHSRQPLTKKTDKRRRPANYIDGCVILNWGLIEAAKYCLTQKLSPENKTTNQFLTILKEELNKPIRCDNQLRRLALMRFLEQLDKLIYDRTIDSSNRKHTFEAAENIERFIDANRDTLRTWFSLNRQTSARAALILGDPAECWRNISLRLWSDIATKYSAINQFQTLSKSSPRRISVSQTLMSLDAKQWRTNLELFAYSAKNLGDIDLLHGLKSLVNFSGLLGGEWKLIDSIINNVELKYNRTFEGFLNSCNDQTIAVDQGNLVEFLNSCVELGKLSENADKIAAIERSNLRSLYEQYLESTTDSSGPTGIKFSRVKEWVSTWSFDPAACSENVETIDSYAKLTLPNLLNQTFYPRNDNATKVPMVKTILSIIEPISTGKNVFELHVDDHDILLTVRSFASFFQGDYDMCTRLASLALHNSKNHHLFDCRLFMMPSFARARSIIEKDYDECLHNCARLHLKNGNTERAMEIAKNLKSRKPGDKSIKFSNELTLLTANGNHKDLTAYQLLSDEIYHTREIGEEVKTRLLSKVARHVWPEDSSGLSKVAEVLELAFVEPAERDQLQKGETDCLARIEHVAHSFEDLPVKILLMIAETLDSQLSAGSGSDLKLMNASFKIDLNILTKAKSGSACDRMDYLVKVAARVLDKIKMYGKELDVANQTMFASQTFFDNTIETIWFNMKSNVISLITCCRNLPSNWICALTRLVKHIAAVYPESILFETMVNRIDLQNKLLVTDTQASPHDSRLSDASLLLQHDASFSSGDQPSSDAAASQCSELLNFWETIYQAILEGDGDKPEEWHTQILETEVFLKEIRRISYLPSEYLKTLTVRLHKKVQQYSDLLKKHINPQTGLIYHKKSFDECQAKLDDMKRYEGKSIEVLKTYLERSRTRPQRTIYDSSMQFEMSQPLGVLDSNFKMLVYGMNLPPKDQENHAKSLMKVLSLCHQKVLEMHDSLKQRFYMEQISPPLSRLKKGLVLMPGYFVDCGGGANDIDRRAKTRSSPITIHKIAQNVQMIHSKTSPKKMTFVGSDGCARSYLLKAHEDLRLDRLVMDLFNSINILLAGNKKTKEFSYELQRYSVTPVSSRSGLIQWVEASSLCSFYRSWASSPNGRRVIDSLFKETCSAVCPNPTEIDSEKHNCIPPKQNQTVNTFHQLLWAKIRTLPRRSGHAVGYDNVAKPTCNNTLRYRREFSTSIYEEVIEYMISTLPQDLITQQLWFDSPHSMSYYLRTRKFVRSCATISMVGYVIGLGDRHPDNILLDTKTGKITHIDYNVCFEQGRKSSIPELVPFRLTQSMIHAFGFAGLEGGFKRSCERVLDLMKEFKSVILHHLDPISFNFMVGAGRANELVFKESKYEAPPEEQQAEIGSAKLREQEAKAKIDSLFRRALSDLTPTSSKGSSILRAPEMTLRSQEEDDPVSSGPRKSTRDEEQQHDSAKVDQNQKKLSPSNKQNSEAPSADQIQFDIKTPTTISPKNVVDICERVRNKLAGRDEMLLSQMPIRVTKDKAKSDSKSKESSDLISLIDEALSSEDQVSGLILEAISNKNKAAMFEGWSPWV